MYSRFQLLKKYIQFHFSASNSRGHGMHSPFVFDFITKVLNDKTVYPAYSNVESLRKQLLKDKTILEIEDFGAGSSVAETNLPAGQAGRRSVASITQHAAKSKKWGQLLFRMVKFYQPNTILELGTSLGITTCYLSLAKPDAKLITMEGAGEIANVAKLIFRTSGFRNIELIEGNFDSTLSSAINSLSFVDFAFIDGNHRREPTERYFNQILSKANNDSILVFDDIHWSKEMEAAWEKIKNDPAVTCSIDLFFVGIIFFRKEFKEKQHFVIRV
jgi:predicted O-methyltransferase YrrM